MESSQEQQEQQHTEATTATEATSAAAAAAAPSATGREAEQEQQQEQQQEQHPSAAVPTIAKLPPALVRRLVGGTAICDLASAVKELVDNALDAGACTINVRLFGGGLDIIEVSDDGVGVPVASRPFLAVPHATSKLDSIQQLYQSTRTLGFRGEALFSLASTSRQLVVATRTADEPVATKLQFLRDGRLDGDNSRQTFPKKIGSTVAVVGFLELLPVRRNDLKNRIAQERGKLVHWMEAYAVFGVGIQMRVMDMVGSNCRESVLLATTMHATTLQDNLSSVLGPALVQSLFDVRVDLTDIVVGKEGGDDQKRNGNGNRQQQQQQQHGERGSDDDVANIDSDDSHSHDDDDDDDDEDRPRYRIYGMLSKADSQPKQGNRQPQQQQQQQQQQQHRMRDRQYFCINGRPVDLPPLARTINTAWKALPTDKKRRPKPSCFLHLVVPPSTYDVNLSPDKRSVLLVHEQEICRRLQEAVTVLWSSQTEGAFAVAGKGAFATKEKKNPQKQQQQPGNEKAAVNNEEDDKVDYESPVLSDHYDSDAEEELGPSRFNRRYAFSHDVKNARLQHEYDDGRQVQRSSEGLDKLGDEKKGEEGADAASATEQPPQRPSILPKLTLDDTGSSHSRGEEKKQDGVSPPTSDGGRQQERQEFSSKRQRLCLQLPVYDHNNDDDEPSSTEAPGRLQQQVAGGDNTTNSVITPSPAQQHENGSQPFFVDTSGNAAAGSRGASSGDAAATPATVNHSHMSPVERRRWNVMQRTFNSAGSSGIEEDIERTTATAAATQMAQPPPNSSSAKNVDSAAPQFGLERFGFGFQAAAATAAAQPPKVHAAAAQKEKEGTTNRPSISESGSIPEPPRRLLSEVPRGPPQRLRSSVIAWDSTKKHDEEGTGEDAGSTVAAAAVDGEDIMPLPVTWESFQGTRDVVLAARAERLAMRDRKRELTTNGANSDSVEIAFSDDSNNGQQPQQESSDTLRLSKSDFGDMTIIGQFNLGFILAKTPDNNIWILDQHACDEKFNFEKLCAETVIHEQRLLAPMPLDLTPAEETCVLDHMELFQKNGFRFKVDFDKPPRQRLALTALPHSGNRDGRKAVQFGKEDVAALCSILGVDESSSSYDGAAGSGTGADGSGLYGNNAVRRYAGSTATQDNAEKVIVRLPKAIAMFASRACRGSIMIGKALSPSEMDQIVKRLKDVSNPWNCPHGRPTMRHVASLHSHLQSDERKARERIAGATVTVSTQEAMDSED